MPECKGLWFRLKSLIPEGARYNVVSFPRLSLAHHLFKDRRRRTSVSIAIVFIVFILSTLT